MQSPRDAGRRDKIRRIFVKEGNRYPDERMPIELDCLDKKIKAIEDMEGLKNGDPLIRDNHEAMYQCRYGMTWEQLQDFQQKQFKK